MLSQLKKLQRDFLIQLGFTVLIVIPFILIAFIGYKNLTSQIADPMFVQQESSIFVVMIVLTAALIYIILRSFYLARSRALLIAQEMTESLRKSEERYKAFIETSSEGIWRYEMEKPLSIKEPVKKQIEHCYKYTYLAECNDVCAQMYGYKKAEEIVGARLTDMLIPTDKKNIEYLTQFINSGYKLINTESKERDKNGSIRYFHNTFVGIVENGFIRRAWGTQRDITEEKEIENTKNNFIINASHELRTPIAGIKGLVIMILEGNFGKVHEPLLVPLKKIETSVENLNQLTDDILDVIKLDSHKLKFLTENVDIDKVIREVLTELNPMAKVKKVGILYTNNQPFVIDADREKVKNIFSNLIENAIKFTSHGKVSIAVSRKDKFVDVSITDSGIGIASEDQHKIFNRFEQISSQTEGKPKGTGLGLYIARELSRKMGGDIRLSKSQLNKGSTFICTLPVMQNKKLE